MDEESNMKKIKNVFTNYTQIWKYILVFMVIGILFTLIGSFGGSSDLFKYIETFGVIFTVGSFLAGFFGILFGLSLGWIVPLVLNMILGVYLGNYIMDAPGAVFAAYTSPFIGGIIGWFASRKKIISDKGVEYEYIKRKKSFFTFNK